MGAIHHCHAAPVQFILRTGSCLPQLRTQIIQFARFLRRRNHFETGKDHASAQEDAPAAKWLQLPAAAHDTELRSDPAFGEGLTAAPVFQVPAVSVNNSPSGGPELVR